METITSESNVNQTNNSHQEDKKPFSVFIKFNGESHHAEVDNLSEYFMSLKPFAVKTKIIMQVVNDKGEICNKVVLGSQAKRLFQNRVMLDKFTRDLIFKQNVSE